MTTKKQSTFLKSQAEALRRERAAQAELADTLQREIASLNDDTGLADTAGEDGFGEGAGAAVEQDRDRALHAGALTRIAEIDAALGRIAAGTYGTCEICHEPIGEARLEALPTAVQCVACKVGGLTARHRSAVSRPAA